MRHQRIGAHVGQHGRLEEGAAERLAVARKLEELLRVRAELVVPVRLYV